MDPTPKRKEFTKEEVTGELPKKRKHMSKKLSFQEAQKRDDFRVALFRSGINDPNYYFKALVGDGESFKTYTGMFGQETKRKVCMYDLKEGNKRTYHYGGSLHVCRDEAPEALLELRQELRRILRCEVVDVLDYALMNLYENGEAALGYHRDDEKEMKADMPIVSVSLGATRDMQFKRGDQVVTISLAAGDVLVMYPITNKEWKHGIPRRTKVKTARLNVTFRTYA